MSEFNSPEKRSQNVDLTNLMNMLTEGVVSPNNIGTVFTPEQSTTKPSQYLKTAIHAGIPLNLEDEQLDSAVRQLGNQFDEERGKVIESMLQALTRSRVHASLARTFLHERKQNPSAISPQKPAVGVDVSSTLPSNEVDVARAEHQLIAREGREWSTQHKLQRARTQAWLQEVMENGRFKTHKNLPTSSILSQIYAQDVRQSVQQNQIYAHHVELAIKKWLSENRKS